MKTGRHCIADVNTLVTICGHLDATGSSLRAFSSDEEAWHSKPLQRRGTHLKRKGDGDKNEIHKDECKRDLDCLTTQGMKGKGNKR